MHKQLNCEAFRAIVEASVDAVVVIERSGNIIFWNEAAKQMFGYCEAEVLGKYVHDILPVGALKDKANAAFNTFKKSGASTLKGKLLHVQGKKKNGETMDVQFSVNSIMFEKELISYAFLRDITEQISLQNKLEEMASIDELTNIYNRRAFIQLFEKQFSFAKRNNTPLSVLMLDLDFFKDINHNFGHAGGDVALRNFSETVSSILRDGDIFGRVGGEEFCILLPNTLLKNSIKVSERIRKEVSEQLISASNKSFKISVSIGLSLLKQQDLSFTDSQKRADDALYEAKRNGRNKVEVAPN